jgi:PAS domain S-box-containing protein
LKNERYESPLAFICAAAVLIGSLLLVASAAAGETRLAAIAFGAAANLGFLVWIFKSSTRHARERAVASAEAERHRQGFAVANSIIEATDDAIITKDLNGVIQGWNTGAERIFGYTAAEAIGKNIMLIVPEDRSEEASGIAERTRRGEPVPKYESVRRRRSGELIDVLVGVAPLRDLDGRVIGACKVARDISEQKRVQREMEAAITELRDVRAALDEHSIVAITDAAGLITFVNDRFCAISKYSREELIGRDHRIINSRHHPKEFFRNLWETIGRGQVWRGEIRNRAKDGSYYWVDTTIFPRLGANGKPNQFIAIRTDVTQRKANELELLRTASELSEKNKELETIVYTVSHDLRSPLVNIQGFGRQLNRSCERMRAVVSGAGENAVRAIDLREAVESTIPQALRFINASTNKIDLLLAGLLRYSRLGKVSMSLVPLEMNALLAEIVAATKFQLNEAKAEIKIGQLPTCVGDSVHTSQVFANLIDNALKYRDPGRPLRIEITGRTEGDRAVYTVSDNGIGIAPDHQAKIFEIFHRLNPDTQNGEGLGLTIAQRVLERQDGKIWVESTAGSGSNFHISLPMTANARAPKQ